MKSQSQTLGQVLLIVVVLAALVGLTWVNYRFARENPGGGDFLPRWAGARFYLVEGRDPYSPSVSMDIQRLFYGRLARRGEDQQHFVYPFYSLVFFAPYALIGDYAFARAVWTTTLEVSLVLLVLVSLRLADWEVSPWKLGGLLLFGLLWYHGMRNVINGQFAALNALLILASLWWIRRGDDIPAGVFLAVATIKPQMVFLIIPFVLLWAWSARRYRIWLGFFLAMGVLVGGSLLLLPGWPLGMLRQIMEYPRYTEIGSPLSIISGMVPGVRVVLSRVLHASFVLYLLVEWGIAWGKDERHFLWAALLTLVVSNLVALRTATTHYVVMLPALFLIFRVWEQRWKARGVWAVWLTLVLLFVGLWWLFVATVKGNQEHALMYLPLPFFTLLGLWWVRWWAVRPPRLMLEDFARWMG